MTHWTRLINGSCWVDLQTRPIRQEYVMGRVELAVSPDPFDLD